jgi:hypothetical protein
MADETLPLPLEPRPEGKRCKRCRKIKPFSEFHYRPEQLRHRAECKECYRTAMTARRDPVDNRRRSKAWGKANPEKRRVQTRRNYERARSDLQRNVGLILKGLRARCKGKVDCSITSTDLLDLFEAQSGRCVLTGLVLVWGTAAGISNQRTLHPDTLSIDRLDHTRGYVVDNIRLVGFQANAARGIWSDDRLSAFCEAVLATRAASEARQ